MSRGPVVTAATEGSVKRGLRIGDRLVRASGPAAIVDRALGPLRALAVDDGSPADSSAPIDVQFERLAPPDVPPAAAVRTTAWVPPPSPAHAPTIVASGIGHATLPRAGPIVVRVREDLPRGDETAERLTVPALAERMRREDVHVVHAAVLLPPQRDVAWLVPAARGGGKTTLSLSLRRAGWRLLSDDRGWLSPRRAKAAGAEAPGAASAGTVEFVVDPWPEPPRVGDRSLYLLPPGIALGVRDPSTGKAQAFSLTPPRVAARVRVDGVLVPRLVDGRGGDVTPLRGADSLAAFTPQAVIATDPETAKASLRLVAMLLERVPCLRTDVGDDPLALAESIARHALGTARSHLGSRSST